jgi:hypothetical protein
MVAASGYLENDNTSFHYYCSFFIDSVIWMSQRGESAKDTKAEHLQPATATNLVSFYFLSFD